MVIIWVYHKWYYSKLLHSVVVEGTEVKSVVNTVIVEPSVASIVVDIVVIGWCSFQMNWF